MWDTSKPESNGQQRSVAIADEPSSNPTVFGTRFRFVMMFLTLFCLASIWSNILSFNFAVICMESGHQRSSNATQSSVTAENGTFSNYEKSLLTSVVAGAALIANFAVVSLVNQFGIRYIFTFLGLLTAVATWLIPLSIRSGFYYVLAARFIQGVAFAANFPVIGGFCSRWAYYKQNGLFVSALVAYVQLSPAITMPVSGFLCGNIGWPSVFYVHGTFCFVLFLVYGMFYRNNPQKHPMVGDKEINKIRIGKVEASSTGCSKKELKKIPYVAILKTPAVWAVWVAAVGNFTCVNLLFLFSPIYINKVLGYEVSKTGLNAALGPIAQFAVKMASGIASDKIKFLSETNKLRLFNSVAFLLPAVFLLILSTLDTSYMTLCMVILGTGTGFLGATTGGFFKAGPLISKQYSHFVTGNISLGLTITMLFLPIMMSILAPHNSASEWSLVFVVVAFGLTISNIIFCTFVSGEPCEWTTQEYVIRHSTRGLNTQPAGATKPQLPVKNGV